MPARTEPTAVPGAVNGATLFVVELEDTSHAEPFARVPILATTDETQAQAICDRDPRLSVTPVPLISGPTVIAGPTERVVSTRDMARLLDVTAAEIGAAIHRFLDGGPLFDDDER